VLVAIGAGVFPAPGSVAFWLELLGLLVGNVPELYKAVWNRENVVSSQWWYANELS
jgi:xanthosine utilization system XapX-like protein